MKKKEIENTVMALVGVTLIITSAILLLKPKPATKVNGSKKSRHYMDYGQSQRDDHVFSETGILL